MQIQFCIDYFDLVTHANSKQKGKSNLRTQVNGRMYPNMHNITYEWHYNFGVSIVGREMYIFYV